MRVRWLLSVILFASAILGACGDKTAKQVSPSVIQKYADGFKDKARAVEGQLQRSADAQHRAIDAQESGSSR